MELCVQDENAFKSDDPNVRAKAWSRARSLGATHVRQMLYINSLNPCRGQPAVEELARFDRLADEAKANGVQLQLVLTGVAAAWGIATLADNSPCPGADGRPSGLNPSVKKFGRYVRSMVSRYASRGVKRFSMWNEPNLAAFLCAGKVKSVAGNIDATKCSGSTTEQAANLYAKLYQRGYEEVQDLKQKGKIPHDVEVLMGELAPGSNAGQFADAVMHGRKLHADGFSWHAYQYCTPPNSKKAEFIKGSSCNRVAGKGFGIAWADDWQNRLARYHGQGSLTTHHGQKVPLYQTEFGYWRAGSSNDIPEPYRAKWLPMALDVGKKNGVRQMNLYQLFAGPGTAGVWDTAILDQTGNPLPSYNAVRAWATMHGYPVTPLTP